MPVVNLMVSDITITEGDAGTKNAVFTVTRDGNPSTAFKAAYTTQDGTGVSGAKAGVDYVESKGYLTFTPGQLKKKIVNSVSLFGMTTSPRGKISTLVMSTTGRTEM